MRSLLLLFAAPVLAVLAVAIKLDSAGPVFYFQERVGRGGKVYRLHKLRTMRKDAETLSGPLCAARKEPRVTRIGDFFFFSSRSRHTRSVSAFLLNRSSDLKECRLDTPIIFIEARINLSRFVVTGCAAKTSATVTFPSLNLISLFAFCFNIWLNGVAS